MVTGGYCSAWWWWGGVLSEGVHNPRSGGTCSARGGLLLAQVPDEVVGLLLATG
jgi:hypothetical protein